ncbi:L-rhamnose mutarotase [Saccharibacillus alkalitolerans]|uniref:L-rhamnose mutarotase n=1 Tax=Saccharibacillus alkalitolerans TaxID=2705290 RepID=A0ABX0FDK2_9BACL|nr:L-rhamnose mutarotase [Saccharibacillus alkalitolerans]NGZ76377.1 L-rhamnose mutarotase [Saccharibacillus alkalitolerans]
MIRKASVMKVYKEHHDEYRRRHDELWPEMEQMLREHGMVEYSIFLDPATDNLFAYLVITDEELWARSADTEVCRRWWAYMKDIMETHADDSPVSFELTEVFRLD